MPPTKPVRFGTFEADLASGQLRKHGIAVRLQEQPAKILGALLERPGEVVSREELVKLLWADGTFVDYDRGLNAAVNRLRQALSDSAESPRYIETVARRGYRFIGALEPAEATPAAPTGEQVETPASKRWLLVAAAVGVLVIAAGTGLLVFGPSESTPEPLPPVPLTSYEGTERQPSFSPDGSQVVFSWDGEKQDNFDLYVKVVGTWSSLRLTTDPAEDSFPT